MLRVSAAELEDCGFYFLVISPTGELLLRGELHLTIEDCKRGAESAIESCYYDVYYDLHSTSYRTFGSVEDLYYFTICDEFGMILATSFHYDSVEERAEKIQFLTRNCWPAGFDEESWDYG